jgi:hypothetical protein
MDNNKHKTHMFPIENRDKYKAYIKFTPIIKNGPTYQNRVNIAQTEAQSSSDTAKSFLENAFNQFGNSAISASTERRGGESVALYMPTPVTIQDGVSIEPASLGILGEGASRSMDAGSGIVAAVGAALQDGMGSLIETLKGNVSGDAASLGASRLAAGLPGPGTDAVRGSLRVTPNPNTRMMFRSVNIREFSFDFKMVPTSKREQEEIKNIVSFFRINLYPEVIKLEGTGGNSIDAGYKFPNLFEIKLMYEGKDLSKDNPNLSFKHMYLKAFTASYNSTGGFYKDGEFNEVSIQVSFAEEFTLNKDDAKLGITSKATAAAKARTEAVLADRARGIERGF